MHATGNSVTGFVLFLVLQIIFVIVFAALGRYGKELLPPTTSSIEGGDGEAVSIMEVTQSKYPHFQDIHVMIFVGFGFLMTFLKKYAYSATGFNLLLGALFVQWAMIMRGVFELEDGHINLNLESMVGADIAVATVLISMGALLGRTTAIQLMVMGVFEIALFAANEYFQLEYMKITDVGGSITVHAFGAYFGLAVSLMLRPSSKGEGESESEGASYNSDTFAMVGTLFLWIFWPSFNSVLVDGADQERAILNTYLSLAAATVTTFMLSALVSHEHKLDMVHIQNSTLAGGVAVGSVCNLLIQPYGAVTIGVLAGALSVFGYRYLSPALTSKFRLNDSCGVHNLHGMPAVLSAIFSAIYSAFANKSLYRDTLYSVFPAMEPRLTNGTMAVESHHEPMPFGGYGRSAEAQAGYQLLGIASTVAIAIVGGLITGLFLRSPSVRRLEKEKLHDDEDAWEVPA